MDRRFEAAASGSVLVSFQYFLTSQWAILLCSGVALATSTAALLWSKYPIRWILAIVTMLMGVFAYFVHVDEISERLPSVFRGDIPFRIWVFSLSVALLYALVHVAYTLTQMYLRRHQPAAGGVFADLDDAWQEILIQLSQARIEPSRQRLFLLLGSDEGLSASVVEAANLDVLVRAPAAADAPIHVYATEDALFLSCAGASELGRPGGDGASRLEHLCRLIAAENPLEPILRGIVGLLTPDEREAAGASRRDVAAIREALQIIRRTLKVRCPTVTVYCLHDESIPGFNDFTSRLPSNLRHHRCGFSVPTTMALSADVLRQGLLWMTQWFQLWSLNLMVKDIRDKDGNSRLMGMNIAFRASNPTRANFLIAALTVHQQDEPLMYRGCYFVACGPDDDHAFATGLLAGPKKERRHPLSDLTTWSREADLLDARYRRAAWALGLLTAAVVIPVWCFAIIPRLTTPGAATLGWASLASLALLWPVVLLARRFTRDRGTA